MTRSLTDIDDRMVVWLHGPAHMSKPRDREDRAAKTVKIRRASANKQIGAQTRKLLGKHYANKYRTGRG